jgi:hypothetical protein
MAGVYELAGPIAFLLLGVLGLASVASLVVRIRRSQGVERQQLKWFTYRAGVLALLLAVSAASQALNDRIPALAVLRYRLYDIDRIINRALAHGLLTVLLGVSYAGTALALGQLIGGLGEDPPSWVVAGATLAVAALFQPARRRIQQEVDRRFNRRKYNTAQTIEAFSTRLRDEVDPDTLSAGVLGVVDQAMQPTTASLGLETGEAAMSGYLTPCMPCHPAPSHEAFRRLARHHLSPAQPGGGTRHCGAMRGGARIAAETC